MTIRTLGQRKEEGNWLSQELSVLLCMGKYFAFLGQGRNASSLLTPSPGTVPSVVQFSLPFLPEACLTCCPCPTLIILQKNRFFTFACEAFHFIVCQYISSIFFKKVTSVLSIKGPAYSIAQRVKDDWPYKVILTKGLVMFIIYLCHDQYIFVKVCFWWH